MAQMVCGVHAMQQELRFPGQKDIEGRPLGWQPMTQKVQIMSTFSNWLKLPKSQAVRMPDGFGGNLTLICPNPRGFQGVPPWLAGLAAFPVNSLLINKLLPVRGVKWWQAGARPIVRGLGTKLRLGRGDSLCLVLTKRVAGVIGAGSLAASSPAALAVR
jgi:hypothetical protein